MKNGGELKMGDEAPEFEALAVGGEYGDGKQVALRDFQAPRVFLFSYPRTTRPAAPSKPVACAILGPASGTRPKSLASVSIQRGVTGSLSKSTVCRSRFSPIPKKAS